MTKNAQHILYISHASGDSQIARELSEKLERLGLPCWLAPRDVVAGASWGDAIAQAIISSKACILILSSKSNESAHVEREVELAFRHNIPVVPYRIEDITPSRSMDLLLAALQWFDAVGTDLDEHIPRFVQWLRQIIPDTVPNSPPHAQKASEKEDKSRGYVFISYVRSDSDFVQKLRKVFESKKYGYWDYVVGNRDYHGTLYRELEERIDGAVAFITIVSDEWRNSDWVASEFIYAREAIIPIFVIQAKKLSRPLPILLNLQTRINMSEDFDQGARTLAYELSKKGL